MNIKALVAVLVGAFVLSACNTMEGVGKDTQAAGKKIEKEAERR